MRCLKTFNDTCRRRSTDRWFDAYLQVLRVLLDEIYSEILKDEGIVDIGDRERRWFDTALSAIDALPHYGTPFYLQLESFEQVEASGLQITLSPGKNIVYLGLCDADHRGIHVVLYPALAVVGLVATNR